MILSCKIYLNSSTIRNYYSSICPQCPAKWKPKMVWLWFKASEINSVYFKLNLLLLISKCTKHLFFFRKSDTFIAQAKLPISFQLISNTFNKLFSVKASNIKLPPFAFILFQWIYNSRKFGCTFIVLHNSLHDKSEIKFFDRFKIFKFWF